MQNKFESSVGTGQIGERVRGSELKSGVRVKIRTKLNKRVLDVAQSADHGHEKGQLILYDDYGADNQQFTLTAEGTDYVIRNVKSGKALQVPKTSHQDGCKVVQADYKSHLNQKWLIQEIAANSGEYYIYNSNSGKVLDVPQEKAENHVCIFQYHFNGNKNQVWILKHV